MNEPFWRDEPLSSQEVRLLELLREAHTKSAQRDSLSTMAVKLSMAGSDDFTKALPAALMTLGGAHAPVREIYEFLLRGLDFLPYPVPGWHTSFAKADHPGSMDPDWKAVDVHLRMMNHPLMEKVDTVTKRLHSMGKLIFPNPGCYTAAAAITLGIPPNMASYLFIIGRLDAWARMCCIRR
jgi:citrate synthase